jgi:anti-anti-sigma regulatory factor
MQLNTSAGHGALRLVGPSAPVARLLQITGMDRFFSVFPDADTAVQA